MGKLFWGGSGGSGYGIGLVGEEEGRVVNSEYAVLGPCEVVTIGGQRRNEAWVDGGVVHG